ncbi:DUF4129 domain-containing protein [Cellulomonas cellasea]|uniref:Protein-glutamine gamma-glutamyltransferase-like C-terminal domain-containing protein n=1 Tax=Cellulomonas cellasea TaxID=43670 RepID=A0A7W4UFZ9_9CELL|nr:DUF4129 domain-containing protein [Cellulomonas cellasea]MBB2923459.1 hypothetical protein [Cellulomonas cellasea]
MGTTPTRLAVRRVAPVAVLVVGVVLAAAAAGPWTVTGRPTAWELFPPPALPPDPPLPTTPPVDLEPGALPPALVTGAGWVVAALGVLVLLVALALLVRYALAALARRGAVPEGDAPTAGAVDLVEGLTVPQLREGVAAAGRRLDEDVPPGDAVVAAWVALEQAAAATGIVRERSTTATELTVEVLGATRADPAATRALLDLYLAARFSEHPVTAADVVAARRCLDVLADGLGLDVARGAPAGTARGTGL